MKLLCESSFLVESGSQNGKMYIEGIFAQAEIKNGNGRFYSKGVMEEAVEQYNANYITKRRALGELNHPERPFADPAESAILIESLTWQGNNVIGKALVMGTPKGLTTKALIESGFNLGVSTRGLGALQERGGLKHVQKGFMMTAVDCVDNPSAPDAYVNALMESTSWINENGVWKPIRDESSLNKGKEFEENVTKALEKFFSDLS